MDLCTEVDGGGGGGPDGLEEGLYRGLYELRLIKGRQTLGNRNGVSRVEGFGV